MDILVYVCFSNYEILIVFSEKNFLKSENFGSEPELKVNLFYVRSTKSSRKWPKIMLPSRLRQRRLTATTIRKRMRWRIRWLKCHLTSKAGKIIKLDILIFLDCC